MKQSVIRELVKQALIETLAEKDTTPDGAMTPEEEEMVANYEKEHSAEYALDNEEPLEEAETDIMAQAREIIRKSKEEEDTVTEATKIVEAWKEGKLLKEEVHGGYLELLKMNPAFEEGVANLLQAWNEWKSGEATEPSMVEEAKQDVLAYLSSMMK